MTGKEFVRKYMEIVKRNTNRNFNIRRTIAEAIAFKLSKLFKSPKRRDSEMRKCLEELREMYHREARAAGKRRKRIGHKATTGGTLC